MDEKENQDNPAKENQVQPAEDYQASLDANPDNRGLSDYAERVKKGESPNTTEEKNMEVHKHPHHVTHKKKANALAAAVPLRIYLLTIYPEAKKQVIEIIEMLKQEYHLENE